MMLAEESPSHSSAGSDIVRDPLPRLDTSTTHSSANSTATSGNPNSPNQPIYIAAPANAHLGHIPRDLGSYIGFQNALLVHQKRLKVNSTQMFRISVTIDQLIANYHAMIAMHLKSSGFSTGSNGADLRKLARAAIVQAIEQWDGLIEERQRTLEEHGASLELASEITYLRKTDKLLEAINLQIAAAEDLAQRMETRESKASWKAFKQSLTS